MINIIKAWFNRYFSDPEAVLLFFILLIGFCLIIFMGSILAPIIASIIFAYLLQWVVIKLEELKMPRLVAVWVVFLGFLGILLVSCLLLVPLLWKQLTTLFDEMPNMVSHAQRALESLSLKYPEYFSQEQLQTLISSMMGDIKTWSNMALRASIASISSIIVWLVYLVLVPFLIFFFLKDRDVILTWVTSFLPHKRGLLSKVSVEVNSQIGNYIRGKVTEMIVVGIATYIVLAGFNIPYAALLSVFVGLSALIPYVGGIVATIPVVIAAFFEYGWTTQFGYVMITYTVVQALDTNILVPLLFSEAVNLHPIAIVLAIIVFGSFWGFWGVFFAIPLATLIKAVIYAWPKKEMKAS